MSDGDTGHRKDRFRRPEWKGPSPEEAPPEEAAPAQLPATDPGPSNREIGLVLQPLKDLADAFRENSETLRSLAEGQARLGKRMERTDRSEAVIQSTQALNDTFRGVQRTQERLLGRLDTERKRPFLLLALVIVLVGGLVGGTLWFLLGWMDTRDEKARTGDRTEWSSALAERAARADDLAEEVAGLKADLARDRREAEEARDEADLLRKQVGELEEVVANQRAEMGGISELNRRNAALSSANAGLERDLDEARRRLTELVDQLAERDSEIARQARRIEELARQALGAAPPEAAEPAPEEAGETPPAETAIPKEAARDPAELARVTSLLNRLLLDSQGSESYRVLKIGGIRGKILYDVILLNLDPEGSEAKRIEAGECRIAVDEVQRRAEFRFRNGHIVYYGVRAPFWGGNYVVPIVNIDPAAWLRSGLTVFETVR